MGCNGSRGLQISSNNAAFTNGKIVQINGEYYLDKNRYHDKLSPNVQKRFE